MQMIFCNVEGVQWLDDVRIVIASDKAKKDQPFLSQPLVLASRVMCVTLLLLISLFAADDLL
jgi:hypothetical protein